MRFGRLQYADSRSKTTIRDEDGAYAGILRLLKRLLSSVVKRQLILILLCLLWGHSEKPEAGKQPSTGKNIIDGYWLYLPENYQVERAYPLILFQGGAGKSNNNIIRPKMTDQSNLPSRACP